MNSQSLFEEQMTAIRCRTSKMFGTLMVIQYLGAIVWAELASPLTWAGVSSSIHPRVLMAVVLGGLIAGPTYAVIRARPAAPITPWVVSLSQMLFSALLIHVSGGRIETHFHIFGSLAFLAFYRDWRLLIPATLAVVVDHFVRGLYFPTSVYGVGSGASFRFIEHSAWVVFEDIFLIISCRAGAQDMKEAAEHQALLEQTNRELNASKQLADRANLSKTTFLSRTSHELRTPMHAILGFGQLLEMSNLDERQRENLGHINNAGQHLLNLINEVLEISQIEMGSSDFSIEPVDASEVIKQSVALMRPRAGQKAIDMLLDVSEPLLVLGDRQRLLQAVLNILSNAIKYSDPESQIVVTLRQGSGTAVIVVTDHGCGLSSDQQAGLFMPFERLGADSKGIEGTGLGLVLTKSMVEAMGGSVTLQSEEGVGTTVALTLKLADRLSFEESTHSANTEVDLQSQVRTRVLLIDDNEATVNLMRKVFQTRQNFEIIACTDGQSGLDTAHNDPPDLVLLDLHLPDMHGSELLFQLQTDDRLAGVPIIIVSADSSLGRVLGPEVDGAFASLSKPVDIHELMDTVDRALNRFLPAA